MARKVGGVKLRSRPVITGLGVVTPLGSSPSELWANLLAGRCAAREWPDLVKEGFRATTACRVPSLPVEDRGRQMALAASRQAVADAAIPLSGRIGVFVGTTMGESALFEAAASGETLTMDEAAAYAFPRAVQEALNLTGPVFAYGTACAAGNYAVAAAAEAVASGEVDAALAGGVDPFSRIAMVGFSRSRAMAPDYCRPFDVSRQGMQLGEAAAFVLLEPLDAARARGARMYATIEALGLSCDAHHLVIPRADGTGMAEAMHNALQHVGLPPEAVGFICAHGSGTKVSDLAEGLAIRAVFDHNPPVTGLKGALGHSLGAATAVETIVTALALHHQWLPPTANLEALDPVLELDVVREARPVSKLRWALNCGFAFGGLNSALLLGAPDTASDHTTRTPSLAALAGWHQASTKGLTFDQSAKWLVEQLRPLMATIDSASTGLYLATTDAGIEASIGLWSEALTHGPSRANPRNFPWTLPSSPAGYLAIAAGIRGPVYVLVGYDEADEAALKHALRDLAHNRVKQALVLRLDMMGATRLTAALLTGDERDGLPLVSPRGGRVGGLVIGPSK